MKVYEGTSVFGGVFDPEFSEPSKQFLVEAEIEPSPENIRLFFANYAEKADIAIPNQVSVFDKALTMT
jgi:hypothetical protein